MFVLEREMLHYTMDLISGSRFALMEVKAILYNLLLNFSFEPNAKSPIPMVLQKSPFVLAPKDGMHLELKPRKA